MINTAFENNVTVTSYAKEYKNQLTGSHNVEHLHESVRTGGKLTNSCR